MESTVQWLKAPDVNAVSKVYRRTNMFRTSKNYVNGEATQLREWVWQGYWGSDLEAVSH